MEQFQDGDYFWGLGKGIGKGRFHPYLSYCFISAKQYLKQEQ